MWHGFSLLLNFGTIGLVTVGMALTAWLPAPITGSPTPTLDGHAALPATGPAATPEPVGTEAAHTPGG